MKFAVGYQLKEEEGESFVDIVRDYQEHVGEVYFPWGDLPSGRAALASRRGHTDWTAQRRLEEDLQAFRGMGLKLDLLFNAACYGHRAISRHLENQVASVLDHLHDVAGGVDTVTTTSLAVARTTRKYFPGIEVRASVNMRIGTIHGMRHVAGLFDGYYVQRDFNRDLAYLGQLKSWADANNKKLYLLANCGCLRFCAGQGFHDNMVAHDAEIDEMDNISDWSPHVCWNLYRHRENWPAVLQGTWIRPEDLHHYQELFPLVKLATRMHAQPRLVLDAYTSGRFRGNVLDLLEPGFAQAFAPVILDNRLFPADWFERTSHCGGECHQCSYCAQVLQRVAIPVDRA